MRQKNINFRSVDCASAEKSQNIRIYYETETLIKFFLNTFLLIFSKLYIFLSLLYRFTVMASNECTPVLYTKIHLRKDIEMKALVGSPVKLEIDQTYSIGKSIAIKINEDVVGHLERRSTRVVWRFLRSGERMDALIYESIRGYTNKARYSIIHHSFEIGIKIHFFGLLRDDAKLLLAHFARKKLNNFPGVSQFQCPENLKSFVSPVKDENGNSSLFLHCIE